MGALTLPMPFPHIQNREMACRIIKHALGRDNCKQPCPNPIPDIRYVRRNGVRVPTTQPKPVEVGGCCSDDPRPVQRRFKQMKFAGFGKYPGSCTPLTAWCGSRPTAPSFQQFASTQIKGGCLVSSAAVLLLRSASGALLGGLRSFAVLFWGEPERKVHGLCTGCVCVVFALLLL